MSSDKSSPKKAKAKITEGQNSEQQNKAFPLYSYVFQKLIQNTNIFKIPPESSYVFCGWESAVVYLIATNKKINISDLPNKLEGTWIVEPNGNYIQLTKFSFMYLVTEKTLLETTLFKISTGGSIKLFDKITFNPKDRFVFEQSHISFCSLVCTSCNQLLQNQETVNFSELVKYLLGKNYRNNVGLIEKIAEKDTSRIYSIIFNSPYFFVSDRNISKTSIKFGSTLRLNQVKTVIDQVVQLLLDNDPFSNGLTQTQLSNLLTVNNVHFKPSLWKNILAADCIFYYGGKYGVRPVVGCYSTASEIMRGNLTFKEVILNHLKMIKGPVQKTQFIKSLKGAEYVKNATIQQITKSDFSTIENFMELMPNIINRKSHYYSIPYELENLFFGGMYFGILKNFLLTNRNNINEKTLIELMQFRVPLNNVTVTFVGRLSFCLESLVNFFELKNTVTLLPYPQPIFLSQNIENQNQTIDQTQTPSDELLLGPPKDMQPQETAAQPLGIIDFGKIEPNKKQRNAFINLIENHFRNQENNLDITPQDIVKAFDGTKTDKFLIDDSRESIECITNELNASDCFAKTDRGTYAYIDAEAYSPPDRIYSGYYEMIYHALEILHILTRSTGIRFPTRHISRLMDGWKFRVHTVSSPIGVFNKKKAFHSTFSKVRDKKYTVIMYSDGLYGLLKFCPEVQKESTDVQGPKDYIDLLVRDANNRRVPNDQDYNDLKECKVTFIIGSEMSAKIEKSIELASGIQPSPPSQKVCEKKPPKTADDKTSVPRSKSPKVIESDSDTSEEIEIESSTESPVEEEESFEANNNADEIDEISEDYESEAWPFENHWDPPEIVVTDFEPQSMFNYSHTILKPRDKADLNELSPPMSDYSPKKSMSSELESLRSQYKNFSLKKAAQFLYQKSGMNKPAKEFESDVWYAVGQTEPWVIAKGK